MGFLDKISGILNNLPMDDPLFGGLIPRRDERPLEREFIRDSRKRDSINTPIRRTGMDKVNDSFLGNQNRQGQQLGQDHDKDSSDRPGRVVFDWSEQELGLKRKALDLEREKFGHARTTDQYESGLKGREQTRKETEDRNRLDLDRDKYDIDVRKQALEEWKNKNPEGDIKTDEEGRLMIIDKRTGKSIDTGLKADQLDEDDKLRIQHEYRKKEIELQNRGRQRNINPSQQRTAEKDAFNEVMNSGKYKDIQDYVEVSEDGRITINRPSDKDIKNIWTTQSLNQQYTNINNINSKIAEFEKEWKSKSEERMNKIFNTGGDDMVDMTDPDGNALRVPSSEVEKLKSSGAKVVGESENKPKSMPKVADDIELTYNDKGDIIGARNRKPTGSSK